MVKQNTKTKKNRSRSVYTKKHYESNDGMLTTVWGPSTWHLLHTISFNYPIKPTCDEKRQYRDFVLNLQYVLPCGKCRKNLRKNFEKLPFLWKHMESRKTFSKYIYDLHEVINTMLHKQSGLSYDDVRERYEHFRARCATPANEMILKSFPDNKTRKNRKNPFNSQDSEKRNPLPNGSDSEKRNPLPNGSDSEKRNPLEKGCTEPIYGEKSKCVLKIVPQTEKCDTFQMNKKCIKRRTP